MNYEVLNLIWHVTIYDKCLQNLFLYSTGQNDKRKIHISKQLMLSGQVKRNNIFILYAYIIYSTSKRHEFRCSELNKAFVVVVYVKYQKVCSYICILH